LLAAWDLAATYLSGGRHDSSTLHGSRSDESTSATSRALADAALMVTMLSGFQIAIGPAEALEPPTGKARTVLKLLLLQRHRPIGRARLCSLFWPDSDAASARNSLNVMLHRLRRWLPPALAVRYSAEGYRLVVAGEVWLDVEQFTLHAQVARQDEERGDLAGATAHYDAAQALYRVDLVDDDDTGLALAPEAQALRAQLNQVLERLAILHEQVGDWHACLRVALRHLGLDECNEAAHRRLMRCYASLGQIQLAERQYGACVRVLREQLGLPPDTETTMLYRRIAGREVA
jgi:DNA-binding SARP family transcriptional activator